MGSSDKGGKIIFSDNIAFSEALGTAMTVFGANVESNHNCFWTPGQPDFRYDGAGFSSLKMYQAASGLDRDSIFSDPQFVSSIPIAPLDFRINRGSACDSAPSHTLIAEPAGGTYDHDQTAIGDPVIGALRVATTANRTAPSAQICDSHCFQHPFEVASSVYLVRLKFAPGMLSGGKREFGFVLNGRKVVVQFDPSKTTGSEGALLQSFLVRASGASIVLEPDATTDTSVVTEVTITRFDTVHGDGPQVIPW